MSNLAPLNPLTSEQYGSILRARSAQYGRSEREEDPVASSEFKPFGPEVLRDYLHARGLRFLRDDEGGFRVDFGPSPEGPALTMWISAEGSEQDILTLRCFADQAIKDSEFDRALIAANRWNVEKRWPKAYCTQQPPWGIVLEMNLVIDHDVPADFVGETLDRWMYGANSFWEWVHAERILSPAVG